MPKKLKSVRITISATYDLGGVEHTRSACQEFEKKEMSNPADLMDAVQRAACNGLQILYNEGLTP